MKPLYLSNQVKKKYHNVTDYVTLLLSSTDFKPNGDTETLKGYNLRVLLDFLVTVKAASHECVIRTGQP